jgi:hypothetical protein
VDTIATQLGLHPDTVRRALETARFARPAVVRPSVVDPYRAFLEATLQRFPRLRATRLVEMVKTLGYHPAHSCSCAARSGRSIRRKGDGEGGLGKGIIASEATCRRTLGGPLTRRWVPLFRHELPMEGGVPRGTNLLVATALGFEIQGVAFTG